MLVGENFVDQFDPAVDRSGMHDADPATTAFEETFAGEAEDVVVFAQTGEKMRGLPFALKAQQVNKIRAPFDGFAEIGE